MRILHLVQGCDERPSEGHDPGVLACRAAILAWPEHRHDVCLVGGSDTATRAAQLGLKPTFRLVPLLSRPVWAAASLRRHSVRLPAPDLVHCWDRHLVPLARRAFGARLPIADAHPIALELASLHRGAPGPGDLAHARLSLRQTLSISPHTPLVALLSESPHAGDAADFASVLALCDAAGLTAAGLVQRGSASLGRARRFRRNSGFRFSLLLLRSPIWRWLPACDAALLAPAPHSRPELRRACVLLAHHLGVPVVAFREPALEDAYPPHLAHALLGPRRSPDSRGTLLSQMLARRSQGLTAAALQSHAAEHAHAVRQAIERSWVRAVRHSMSETLT